MRTVWLFTRSCFRQGSQHVRPSLFRSHRLPFSTFQRTQKNWFRRPTIAGPILLSALTPAAFIKLSENDGDDGKTGETHMLEASREELKKSVPDNVHGLRRAWHEFVFVIDQYIYEPLATGLRFLHLVFIFVPVIITVPVIWIGRRHKDRDNERGGTLWWYGFLVRSMERAGPAFIKVRIFSYKRSQCRLITPFSLVNGQHRGQISSLQRCALSCPLFIPTLLHTLSMPR